MSSVWTPYFKRIDRKTCLCTLCKRNVMANHGNTSNLMKHVKSNHKKEFAEASERVEEKAKDLKRKQAEGEVEEGPKQKKLDQFIGCVESWKSTDYRKLTADTKLTEMICLDIQPMSIVEDSGFKSFVNAIQPAYNLPTRRELRYNLVPTLYDKTKANIREQLGMVDTVSITTDHWTSRANEAYMAVTAHFLTKDFQPRDFCLDVAYMPQSHTAENISHELIETMKRWIPKEASTVQIYVLSDNASNIQAACRLLPDNYTSLNCFAHTLQLVIKDVLKEFPGAHHVIAKCQKIVNHFHHSAKSTHTLKEMQKNMKMPEHKLKSQCETRWNSTFYMMERIVEQKQPLNAVLASMMKVNNLFPTEWKIAEEYVHVLQPFENATTIMSATQYSTLSLVIPVLNTLCDEMKITELNTFGESVIKNINRRWADYENNKLYYIATMLDPRFKQYAFSSNDVKETAKDTLLTEVIDAHEQRAEMEKTKKNSNTETQKAPPPAADSVPSTSAAIETEPTSTPATEKRDFWGLFKQKVAKTKDEDEVPTQNKEELKAVMLYEIDRYMREPLIDPSNCPFRWWKKHCQTYSNLAPLARLYLGIPSTSVPSERIFSKAGLTISDRRCSLKPSHAEQLVFLNHNLKAKLSDKA